MTPLEAVNIAMERDQDTSRRNYVGFSAIGSSCSRKLWYDFNGEEREPFTAHTLRLFADGHAGEDVMVERFKRAGYDIWGAQTAFTMFEGKFKGHCDGFIKIDDVTHVWEHKCVGKPIRKKDGSQSITDLMSWNYTYYIQAQMYMHCSEIYEHYMTISSAGERDTIEIYTDYNPAIVDIMIRKAEYIIDSDVPPDRVSEDSSWWECRFCSFKGVCHGK